MSQMVVVAYPDEATAVQAREKLVELQRQKLITLEDAAVAVRGMNGKVKIKQAVNLAGAGAMSGAFWGMLIGLIFLVPGLGLLVGAASGALSGKMMDLGIDDAFIKETSEAVQPGTAALFLLVREATTDRVLAEMKQFGGTIIKTNLSQEQEDNLRAAFSAE